MGAAHNPDEVVAKVDDLDNIVGRCKRAELDLGTLHRECAVLITNPQKLILVQVRADNGKLDYSAAGHFGFDEDYLSGAVREVYEELGLVISPEKFNLVSKHRIASKGTPNNNRFVSLFEVCGEYRLAEMKLDPTEVRAVNYYASNELIDMIKYEPGKMTGGFVVSLRMYFESKGILTLHEREE